MPEHILTLTTGGVTHEYEVAGGEHETFDLVRALFEHAQTGQVVELPVRVPGSQTPGRLIVNIANIATALISERDVRERP